MLLKKWEDLPENMRSKEVKKHYESLKKKQFQLIMKRLFDIAMSIIMIVLLSPLFLFIAILIKFDSKGSVFYRQVRITQYGRKFRIFKFRTMVSNADEIGTLVTIQNDARITKIGNKIRKVRFDEVPQLFNILKGDMSFVGTRPEVMKYVAEYSDEMLATLLLPAGVTSLASIKFKDEDEIINKFAAQQFSVDQAYIEYVLPEKMKINLEYINGFSFIKDIVICFKTLGI